MRTKKNKKADLEQMKRTFFLVGLVVSLTYVLFAFKPSTEMKAVKDLGTTVVEPPEEFNIPITNDEDEPKITPPLPLIVLDKILIVENTIDVDELSAMNTEDGWSPSDLNLS